MVDDQQPVVLEKHNNAAEIVKNIKNKWGFFGGEAHLKNAEVQAGTTHIFWVKQEQPRGFILTGDGDQKKVCPI